jgi:group II intron reverse transcriptase/maturase
MSTELQRISGRAKANPTLRFTTIAHHLTPDALYRAFGGLRRKASPGVDGLTVKEYEKDAQERIKALHERLKSKTYRAQPLRRVFIPKENGQQRPIAIPSLEDKIVQGATVDLLELIYEQDFLPCSYGFRPGRGAQDALNEVGRVIYQRPISYVLELDITSYFDTVVRGQLLELIGRRIGDGSILRLIGKWIHVGVIEEGRLLVNKTGIGQGQVISPLLANIYLHYVLDRWFEEEVKPRLRGEAHEIRYADDGLLCFQYREDAERVLKVLHQRFAKYGLTLHPEKTRLVEFGRDAAQNRAREGKGKPETFDFLGFTHICAQSRRGLFTIQLRTMRKRYRRSLKAITRWCQKHRHDDMDDQRVELNLKLRGHYQYYGRPTNFQALARFYRAVRRIWHKWLMRRTRGWRLTWKDFQRYLNRSPLLQPRITVRPWAHKGSLA